MHCRVGFRRPGGDWPAEVSCWTGGMLKSALAFVNDALLFLNHWPMYSTVLVAFHKDDALQVLFKPW